MSKDKVVYRDYLFLGLHHSIEIIITQDEIVEIHILFNQEEISPISDVMLNSVTLNLDRYNDLLLKLRHAQLFMEKLVGNTNA